MIEHSVVIEDGRMLVVARRENGSEELWFLTLGEIKKAFDNAKPPVENIVLEPVLLDDGLDGLDEVFANDDDEEIDWKIQEEEPGKISYRINLDRSEVLCYTKEA